MNVTVDANVLLYASDRSSPFHRRARDVVEDLARGPTIVYLFWPTIAAYLRIATHPAIFGAPLSPAEAYANVDALLSRPHVRAPGEGDDFWYRFREAAGNPPVGGNLVPDAHLVALMLEHGVRTILSHDRDLRRFDGIRVKDPFQ